MYTYFSKHHLLDEKIFLKRGNWRKYKKNEKKVDFFLKTIGGKTKIYNNLNIGIESTIDIDNACLDKYTFIENFLKIPSEKKYVPNQIALIPEKISKNVINFIKKKKHCLVKPVSVKKGIGIFHVSSEEELRNNYFKINKTYDWKQEKLKQKNKVHWVLQEYINDPMLYKGYKFHIRTYYIVTSDGQQFLSRKSFLFLAKKKYKKDEYDDPSIHDTHYDEKNEIIFDEKKPIGFTSLEYSKIKKDIIKIHKIFISKLSITCYDNVNFCYKILGADIIFTKDGQVKVLELNDFPILKFRFDFFNYLMEGIMQEIIDKKYPPKIKQKRNKNLIPL